MVCHALPPPLPANAIINGAIGRIRSDPELSDIYNFSNINYDNEEIFGARGFTLAANTALVCQENTKLLFIGRTVEEGWVILDHGEPRWKRLGWLDYGIKDKNIMVSDAIAVAKDVKKVLENVEWVYGEEGWRYEAPATISHSRIREMARGHFLVFLYVEPEQDLPWDLQ